MGVRLSVRSCWASRTDADAVYELEQTRIVIGRGRGADVRLPHRSVSVRHATIEQSGARYAIVDHATTNRTSVKGTRVVHGRHKRVAREAREGCEARLDPILTVLTGPREGDMISVPEGPSRLVLGRGEDADITLPDEDASRLHAELEVDLDGVLLRDLESKNGTRVGDRAIDTHRLRDREEFSVGATLLRFEDPAATHVAQLEEGEDEATTPPSWADIQPPPPEPEEEEDATLVDAEQAPAALQPPKPAPVRRVAVADMVIYVLAAAVFAVSLLGLFWILRG